MRTQFVALGVALVLSAGCATTSADSTPVQSTPASTAPTQVSSARPGSIPVGQELDVRLMTSLNSDTAQVEQRFETTTVVDVVQDGQVLIPAGSVVRGIVSSVQSAGRIDRTGRMTLAFDELTVRSRSVPIRATATEAFKSEGISGETGKIATGGGVGAIIGGLLGGFKGALTGILVGAGGVIAATEGQDVNLPQGTIIRIRFDSEVNVR